MDDDDDDDDGIILNILNILNTYQHLLIHDKKNVMAACMHACKKPHKN